MASIGRVIGRYCCNFCVVLISISILRPSCIDVLIRVLVVTIVVVVAVVVVAVVVVVVVTKVHIVA